MVGGFGDAATEGWSFDVVVGAEGGGRWSGRPLASDFDDVVTTGVEKVGVDDGADFGRDLEESGLSVHGDGE